MRIILFASVLLLCRLGFGQVVFEGIVTNEQKEPLAGVMVTLKKDVSGPVLVFSRTNASGYYKITYKGNVDSLRIFARAMAYEEQGTMILTGKNTYDFILRPSSWNLEEILVRPPVSRKKDTLSYQVDYFTRAGDRTLADVIKRIPGLEVSQTGSITYQGNPIEKYYIEGLDLLGDGYGLANNNLPADKVDRVEILENHQSLRMLEGIQHSNRTSLNIKLKNKYTTTIPVAMGAGGSPAMGLAEFLPMVFSPDRQFIGGFKANNTGKDISMDGLQHNSLQDLITEQAGNARTDIIHVNSPAITADRYRFNESAYGTLNSLSRIKKDLQLRFNAWYLSDHFSMRGESKTRYNLDEDTVVFSEENATDQQNNKLHMEADLFENSTGKFFKNALKMTFDHKKGWGDLLTNNARLDQKAESQVRDFNNDFGYLVKVGSQLIQVSSAVSYKNIPQSLRIINDGYTFPFSENAKEILQEVNDKKLHADLMLRAHRKTGGFNYSLRTGGEVKHEQMASLLSVGRTGYYGNDLRWKESSLLVDPQIERNRDNWQLRMNFPLAYRSFQIKDDLYDMNHKIIRLPFEPSFFLKYAFRKDWELQTDFRRNYRFGSIENMYMGFVLQDYRSLNRKNGPLAEDLRNVASVVVRYHNPFKYINGWLTARYSHIERNSITSGQIYENGGTTTIVYNQKNPLQIAGVNGVLRYISPYRGATVGLQGEWNRQASQIIINDRLTKLQNNSLNARLGWGILLAKKVNLKVDHEITRTISRPEGARVSEIFYQKHVADIRYTINQKHFLWTKGEYYTFKMTDNTTETGFWDLGYRYIHKKSEIEALWQNILNKNRFQNGMVSAFSEFYQSVTLRPTQFLLTFRWTFSP